METNTEKQSEIIKALFTNNESVINRLYVNNYPKVEHYILKNNGNEQDAKDIFQDAFMTLWRKVRSGNFISQNETGIEGFIYRVAKNKWLDYLRSSKFKKSVPYDNLTDNKLMDEKNHIHEEEDDGYQAKLATAMSAFKDLGEDCQNVLKKFYFEKKSIQDIADELALGAASTRNKKYRCMQVLRELALNNKETKLSSLD